MIPGIVASGGRFLDLAALPNCALWLDASDSSTITLSDGKVSQINDKSGNARHFTQGTYSLQPGIDTTQNGLAVLDFDGGDRLLLGSSGLGRNVAGMTIYAVAKFDTLSSRSAIFSLSHGAAVGYNRLLLEASVTANKPGVGGRRLDGDSYQIVQGATNCPSGFAAYTGILDYANSDAFIYVGATLDGSTTSFQTDGNTSDTDSLQSAIGANIPYFLDGKIGELAVFHAAHDADTRSLIWAYLNRKWGLS